MFTLLLIGCGALLGITVAATRARIDENHARRFIELARELSGTQDALPAIRWQSDLWPLCNGQALVRGSADGYGGPVRYLLAVDLPATTPDHQAHLHGLRVIEHQETPGLADFIDRPDAPWMRALRGRSAADLAGVDTVSGATITSRALLRAITADLGRPALETLKCGA
ncbi:MAG: FMN-binding protein [Pseudomonadales bacterium]